MTTIRAAFHLHCSSPVRRQKFSTTAADIRTALNDSSLLSYENEFSPQKSSRGILPRLMSVFLPCDSDLRNTQHRGASGSPLPRDQEGRDHQRREKVFRNDKGVGISFFIFSLFQTRPGSLLLSLLRVTAAFADIKFVKGGGPQPQGATGSPSANVRISESGEWN